MTHTSTEQPEALRIANELDDEFGFYGQARRAVEALSEKAKKYDHLLPYLCKTCGGYGLLDRRCHDDPLGSEPCPDCNAEPQAQRVPMSEHEKALQFLAGLHPSITIDGPPMAVAELIFDAVQADQRALKEEISKQERNLDLMRKELAKRAPKAKDCQRPECIARGCFGYCMKGITQEKQE